MLYLAIDPGDTTGICLASYTLGWPNNHISVLSSEPWEEVKGKIVKLCKAFEVVIIVERSPQWKATNKQLEKVGWVVNVGKQLSQQIGEPSLIILSPGDWKPVAKARKWKHPEAKDQHQIDAFNLFRYYIWRRYRIEIPYLPIEGVETYETQHSNSG